jgi:ABC-type Fe3+/spermidine/putrescine transport system ATPase subunit
VGGSVTVGGIPIHKKGSISKRYGAGVVALVQQDDALFPQLTVEETLTYSALLRLPTTTSIKDKLKRVCIFRFISKVLQSANVVFLQVEYTISSLGLDHAKHSAIG